MKIRNAVQLLYSETKENRADGARILKATRQGEFVEVRKCVASGNSDLNFQVNSMIIYYCPNFVELLLIG